MLLCIRGAVERHNKTNKCRWHMSVEKLMIQSNTYRVFGRWGNGMKRLVETDGRRDESLHK